MASPSEVLDNLHAAIDAVAELDTDLFDTQALLAFGRVHEQTQTRLQAHGLEVLAAIDDRGAWALDAAYNLGNWVAAQTGTSKTDAGWRSRVAGLLRHLPATTVSHRAGRITFTHVHLMGRCLGPRTREAFTPETEVRLVEIAETTTADEFAQVIAAWIDAHDTDGPPPGAEGEGDELWAARTLGGRVLGTFNFGPELGTAFLAALEEKTDEVFRRDHTNAQVDPTDGGLDRSAANRRAHALGELIEAGAAAGVAGQRRGVAFTVLLDAATAAGDTPDDPADELHQLTDGTHIPRRLIEAWLCDSEIARMVLSITGAVVDVGRAVRTANRAQRRALAARDRGCAVPGCDRPVPWCHAHHVKWWQDGGTTDLDNLVLLCTHHHRRVHNRELTVTMRDGAPVFTNQHGTELTHPRHHRRRPDAA